MGSNSAVHVWFTALFIPLIATCHCATVFKRYHLAYPNSRMSQWSMAYQNMQLTHCIARCSKNVTCTTISYDVIHGDCRLSHWSVPLATKVAAEGWSLYKLDQPCPDIDDYFTIGNYSVAICSQRVTKAEAESLCASFGFGRLVEIRTEAMYLAISDYLNSMPQALKDLYNGIWIAGEYNASGVYSFPDGSPVTIKAETDHDTCCRACLRMRRALSYKYDDRFCTKQDSYMCEQIF